ncbi:MAG: CinA family protein [Hyphomicrobium sp.]
MDLSPLKPVALQLTRALGERGITLVTAESCTGGLIASALTSLPGASVVFERGFVTYSNLSKSEALGVEGSVISRYGAVSREVAEAMTAGALRHSAAGLALAVTGIAGPDGGTPAKPVGLVHVAAARRLGPTLQLERRYGPLSREDIRMAAARDAMTLALETLTCPIS